MLPAEDAELDRMIETAARENDFDGFLMIVMAALHAERPVDARHLARGLPLMEGPTWIGLAAFHMKGDVAEHLMDAVRNKRQSSDVLSQTLFIVAAWCQEHRGGVLPEDLITLARMQARAPTATPMTYYALQAVAQQTNDEGLKQILRAKEEEVKRKLLERPAGSGHRPSAEEAEKIIQATGSSYAHVVLKHYRGPVMDMIPEKPVNEVVSPIPLRRAASSVGRNEPCPCGSGKKHKHCCLGKQQERWLHSSPVAGRTWEEVMADPEPHLTWVWLERCDAYQVARFDPKKIAPELLSPYFERLFVFHLWDRATEAFEQLGYSEALAKTWERATAFATQDGRRDLLRRLVDLRPNAVEVEKNLTMYSALLLAEGDPGRILEILDRFTTEVLKSNLDDLKGFTLQMLASRFRGLGILVARGAVPFLSREDAALVYEHLLLARDRLKLPPDDLCEDIIDELFIESRPDDGKDAAALREAQRKLGDKVKEVGQLKESLHRMQRELEKRERAAHGAASAPAPAGPVPSAAPAGEDSPLKELRAKVESLKTALKERHSERNDLRRELQKAHNDLEELRQKSAPAVPAGNGHDADHEEDLLLPQEAPQTQPVRVIEFPKHFQESLASLPKSVSRGTMTMLGRLAAGEPAAFVGAVRLKACPSILRHRIGIDFRLLFRLLSDRVQVVDLIPRQDLERKIKTLV